MQAERSQRTMDASASDRSRLTRFDAHLLRGPCTMSSAQSWSVLRAVSRRFRVRLTAQLGAVAREGARERRRCEGARERVGTHSRLVWRGTSDPLRCLLTVARLAPASRNAELSPSGRDIGSGAEAMSAIVLVSHAHASYSLCFASIAVPFLLSPSPASTAAPPPHSSS
jgi:hypothetical protein